MAKIDVTSIEGYADMTAEEKLQALESYNIPDPDYTGYVRKETFDKTASELAAKKRELNEKLSDDEKRQAEEQEQRQDLERKYKKLLRESEISKNKSKLLALGYAEALADETAEAMADGNLEKVFVNQKKHLDSVEKRIRAEVLKETPKPTGDGESNKIMTLKEFRDMSPADRLKFSQEHPEEYKELYAGGSSEN